MDEQAKPERMETGTEALLVAYAKAALISEGGLADYLAGKGDVTGEATRVIDGQPGPQRMGVLFDVVMTDAEVAKAGGRQFLEATGRMFSPAMNASPCPCGSGKPFGDCCKATLRLATRAAQAAIEAKPKGGNGKDSRRSMAEMALAASSGSDWAIVIVPHPNNPLLYRLECVRYKDDARTVTEPMPLDHFADILSAVDLDAQRQLTIQSVFEAIQKGGGSRVPRQLMPKIGRQH
jgi:hypothetical protein